MSSYDVLVPAYNVERTIAATLDSLLAQSLPPARIIVADDASPDAAAEVAERYDGVEVVRYPDNRGLNGVQNRALELVTAELVAMVDSDDVWHPETGRVLVEAIERHGAAGTAVWREPFPYDGDPSLPDPGQPEWRELSYDELLHMNVLPKSGTMYRTRAVRDVDGLRVEAGIAGDHDLALRIMEAGGRIFVTPWPGMGFRLSPGSYSRGNPGKALGDHLSIAMPRLSSGDARRHARTLWLRTLARAAHDGHDLKDVPPLRQFGVEGPAGQRALEAIVRSPLRHGLAAGWRARRR